MASGAPLRAPASPAPPAPPPPMAPPPEGQDAAGAGTPGLAAVPSVSEAINAAAAAVPEALNAAVAAASATMTELLTAVADTTAGTPVEAARLPEAVSATAAAASAALSTAAAAIAPGRLAKRVLGGLLDPDASSLLGSPPYELALLLDATQPREALVNVLERLLAAGVRVHVAGPERTLQPDRILVLAQLPPARLEQEAARALTNDYLKARQRNRRRKRRAVGC